MSVVQVQWVCNLSPFSNLKLKVNIGAVRGRKRREEPCLINMDMGSNRFRDLNIIDLGQEFVDRLRYFVRQGARTCTYSDQSDPCSGRFQ